MIAKFKVFLENKTVLRQLRGRHKGGGDTNNPRKLGVASKCRM